MDETEGNISVNDVDKHFALHSFTYSLAMAKIRKVFKRVLNRARERIAARKNKANN